MKPSKEIPDYDRSKKKIKGIASFYGLDDGFHGKLTANGEVFDMNGMTAAHRTLPLGSHVRVTNLENEKTLTRIVDILGKEVLPTKNTPLFYIYSDGSIEHKIIIN